MPIEKERFKKTVKEAIANNLDVDINKVTDDSLLIEDLGMDSLGAVELTFELKEKFEVDIPQDDFKKIKKVKDIEEYISSRTK